MLWDMNISIPQLFLVVFTWNHWWCLPDMFILIHRSRCWRWYFQVQWSCSFGIINDHQYLIRRCLEPQMIMKDQLWDGKFGIWGCLRNNTFISWKLHWRIFQILVTNDLCIQYIQNKMVNRVMTYSNFYIYIYTYISYIHNICIYIFYPCIISIYVPMW